MNNLQRLTANIALPKKLLAFRSNCETEPATYIFDIFKTAQFNTCEFDEIEIRK